MTKLEKYEKREILSNVINARSQLLQLLFLSLFLEYDRCNQ